MSLYSKFMLCAAGILWAEPSNKAMIPSDHLSSFVMVSPEEMLTINVIEKMKIQAKWKAIKSAVENAGGRVVTIDGSNQSGGQKEVWARDKYLLVGNVAYLPDNLVALRLPGNYASEIDQMEIFLRNRGIKIVRVKDAWFEGGNVIQHAKSKTIFLGFQYGHSAQLLEEVINKTQPEKYKVLPVDLVNASRPDFSVNQDGSYLYHLDTGMSEPLAGGEVLLSQDITDPDTLKKIVKIIGHENIIFLSRKDSIGYAANLISVGRTVITNTVSEHLRITLQNKGYKVIEGKDFSLDQLGFGNSGPHCNVNVLPPKNFEII